MHTKLRMGENHCGAAVFAVELFQPGDLLIELQGARVNRSELPSPYEAFEDRYLQIGPETYVGPSGSFDDYINHSCEPNCGLRFGESIWVMAIRPILPGDEVTIDYSTTMDEDDWEMQCDCRAPSCRGWIQDFKNLPLELRDRYISLGIVPEYLLGNFV